MAEGNKVNEGQMFAPSAFAQIEELAKQEGINLDEDSKPLFEADDIEGFVEMPFDIMALITKYEGWGLEEDEAKRLAKIWVKPFQRILGKYPNADLYVALGVTAAMLTEKYVAFRIEHKHSPRDAGTRQDELSQVAPASR